MSQIKLNICVAACNNLGIGIKGNLPWRLKKELKHFSRVTTMTSDAEKRNAVIMGRKTYFGIPEKKRPLPNRLNIVLTSNSTLDVPSDVILCKSLSEAMELLATEETFKNSIENVWICGGFSVYKEAMELDSCHRIYFTEIKEQFDCDAFFPEIDLQRYKKIQIDDPEIPEEEQIENGIRYSYCIFERD